MARTPKVVEDRREQIIEAAMRVFAQKGFTRATNKDIAREAGITAGLIYHYFESKEAVLKAIIEGRSPLKVVRSMPEQRADIAYCRVRRVCATHPGISAGSDTQSRGFAIGGFSATGSHSVSGKVSCYENGKR